MEYRVWNEIGDLISTHRTRAAAEKSEAKAQEECAKECGTDGREETPGRGNFKCGVLSPHGIHIQVVDSKGYDVTGDPCL